MPKRRLVLLVEDHIKILEANKRALRQAGYEVLAASTLASARRQMTMAAPDLVVLDRMLPDGDGIDFIGEIRAVSAAPVLILTALSEKDERLRGLRAGGDDYITKPYDIEEFCARVDAALRRVQMDQRRGTRRLVYGNVAADLLALRVYVNGEDALLKPKEYGLFLLLAEHMGEFIPADRLYQMAWGNAPVGDADMRSLRVHIHALRRKLDCGGVSVLDIETARGRGYRMLLCAAELGENEG